MNQRSRVLFAAAIVIAALAACSATSPSPTVHDESNVPAGQLPATDAPARGSPDTDAPPPEAPAPRTDAPDGLGATDLDGVGGACRGENACVLVRPPCGDVGSAPRERAAAIQARYDEIASVAECAAPRPVVPVEPICSPIGCDVHPRAHPQVLRCATDRDCIPFEWGCRWSTVARSQEREARRLMPIGPACPGILPVEPDVRCTFGFCSLGIDAIPR